ncbi:sensor histidine kinase [Paenibacillus chungangensis]|uniref:histidine kinase n=1 Tax=Paenibacillus chungangensis TaxID=696535 RepID=A0ABW3HUH8_9BACL
MIYVMLLCLVFFVLLIIRNRDSLSTRFLFGVIAGWTLSFVALVLYIGKFNYYYQIQQAFFDFSPGTWNYLVLANLHPELLIRMLNGGVILYNYAILCFALSFTRFRVLHRKPVYGLLTALLLLQVSFFDPWVQLALQNQAHASSSAFLWRDTMQWIEHVMQWMNWCMPVIALSLFAIYYIRFPRIKFLKRYALVQTLSVMPIIAIHYMMFSWAPRNLVRATYLDGYINYAHPQIIDAKLLFTVFPYVVVLAFAFIFYLLFRYRSIEAYHRSRDMRVDNSIDTANLGVRAFTHALKNHLLAIRSEAEYLQDKHASDEDTAYSLRLMLDSCERSFRSIDDAANKLGHIQLNLQPQPLSLPVAQAMERFRHLQYEPQIIARYHPEELLVYMDTVHMEETVANMIENAVESLRRSDRKGTLRLSTERHNHWGVIKIADNGPGMSDEELERVFSPFYTTKSSVNNWGIGLSFCHQIVSGHDGKIEVDSKPGEGAVFRILLPLING